MKLLFIGALAAAALAAPAQAGDVVVSISGVKPGGGEVWAVLQRSGQFLKAQGAYRMKVPASAKTVQVVFSNVQAGNYAASAIQDTNGDGNVAIGAQGPAEQWGVSGPAQTGQPKFGRASKRVTREGGELSVALRAI